LSSPSSSVRTSSGQAIKGSVRPRAAACWLVTNAGRDWYTPWRMLAFSLDSPPRILATCVAGRERGHTATRSLALELLPRPLLRFV
jgi:hypothetical protein